MALRKYSLDDLPPRLPGIADTRLETYREFHILARRIFPRRKVVRRSGELTIDEAPRYQLRVVSPRGGILLMLRRADLDDPGHRLNVRFGRAVEDARHAVDRWHKGQAIPGRLMSPLFWGGLVAGSGAAAFLAPVSLPAAGMAALGALGCMAAPGLRFYPKLAPALKLFGYTWDDNDFCRGWFGTGKTGCGKTQSGVNGLLAGVSRGRPNWGGMCLDQKGLYHEELTPMMRAFEREDDLQLLQIHPPNASEDWVPPAQYNLLSDERIPSRTVAKTVMDTSKRVAGADDPNPFFPQQAQQQIFAANEFFRIARKYHPTVFPGPPALDRIYDLLSYEHICKESIKVLRAAAPGNEEVKRVTQMLELDYLGQPEEQKGGVKATAQLALVPFTTPEVREIFCCQNNTADIEDINDGAVFCISMPQRFEVERVFVATIMKEIGFSQLFRRFDPREAWQRKLTDESLFIIFQDEWQRFITERDLDTDRSREARGTVVAFTQGHGSPLVAINETKLRTGLSNLANRIHGRAADDYDAQEVAKFFPMITKLVRDRPGKGGKAYREVPKYDPNKLLKSMGKFEMILAHCEQGDRRVVLHPTGRDGNTPKWYPRYLKTFGNALLRLGLYRTLARLHFGAPGGGNLAPPGLSMEEMQALSPVEKLLTRELGSPAEIDSNQGQVREALKEKRPARPLTDLPGAEGVGEDDDGDGGAEPIEGGGSGNRREMHAAAGVTVGR